jgi:hypothetical protein
MKWLYLLVACFLLAGCGVDWFPAPVLPNAAAPNSFTFTPQNVSIDTLANNPSTIVSSNTVTLAGTNTAGWATTFKTYSGATGSLKVGTTSYNPGDTIPNVMPQQTLQIDLTPSVTVGHSVKASVTVGTYTANFIVTTTASTNAAAPNSFTFPAQSVSVATVANGVSPVSSKTVTVTGSNSNGWATAFRSYSGAVSLLTIGDSSGGLTYSYDPGVTIPNVTPNQTLEIDLTPSLVVGQSVRASVVLGSYSTSFVVTTTK